MADTHGTQEPHEPQEDTSDHGHDAASDEPITRPDGTMPPSGQRPLSLGIGIAGTLILLLVVAGVILYMNRNGNTAEAPGGANTAGGAAPEAILTNASLKELNIGSALTGSNVTVGQLQPGTFRQQSGLVKVRPSDNGRTKSVSIKAATATARTPTPGAGGRATATPTKVAQAITYQDSDGRFTIRLPAGWTADDSQKNDWFIVEFTGTDSQGGPFFDVCSEDAGDGTLDDFIALDQKSHTDNTKFTIKDSTVTDTTVLGESARTFTYTYVAKTKPNATPWTGQIWEFIHNGARWRFSVDAIGSHKSEVSAILTAFTFTDGDNTNGNGESTTWTDPDGLVTLTFPSAWTPGKADGDDANVLLVKSPDGASYGLDIFDQQGTPADELKSVRDGRTANTGFKFTFGTVVDLKIGGEPAKMLPWTWVSKQNASSKGAGRDYVVNHNGKWFGITALTSDTTAFGDLEAIITSMTFGGSGNGNNTGQGTTWKDANGLLQLQYPNGWTATVDTSDKYNVVILDSPDGGEIFIEVFDPQSGTLDQEIQGDKDFHAKSTKYIYKDGAVTDLKIGGEPAKALSYTYVPKDKPSTPPNPGQIWEVNHGGKEIYIQASPYSTNKAAFDTIVASITFGK